MIYWAIQFKDGSVGYQVMNEIMACIAVTDENGNVLSGPLEYTTVSDDQTGPFPALKYA